MQAKIVEKYFFIGLLFITFVFTFFIFQPFWVVLVLGVSFAVVLYPVHEWLNKKKIPNWISALLTVLLFTIVLGVPLLGVGNIVFDQSQDAYNNLVKNDVNVELFLSSLEERVNKVVPEVVALDINDKTTELVSYISQNIANIFRTTINAFFSFILMLFIIFYFLKDGPRWKNILVSLSPLGDKDDEKILSMLGHSVSTVIKGYLLIAVAQGFLMGLGLWLFNVPSFALWGVVAALVSFIPTIGTALVSIPAVIFLFVVNDTTSAIGLAVWATLIVSMVDNFLNPLIVGSRIHIPPLLVLFSVLGGISLLGPVGILVGPLTVSLLFTLVSIYKNEFSQNTQGTAV